MLEQLLRRIQEGGTYSLLELARMLDVSPALVEQMLEDLVRMGRLQVVQGCQQGACQGCPSAQNCLPARPVRLWRVNS